jgi:hypothetical protein
MIALRRKKARLCGKCDGRSNLTLHHVLPKRYFQNCLIKATLCRECHDKLELIIGQAEENSGGSLSVCEYFHLLINFVLLEEYGPEDKIQSSHRIMLENPEIVKEKNGQLTIFLKKSINFLDDLNAENTCSFRDMLFICENL